MADKVHPSPRPTPPSPDREVTVPAPESPRPTPPSTDKEVPAPAYGTYVIQIPKDQIYRVPPPENALRYKHLSQPKSRRRTLGYCCRCFFFSALVFFILLAVAAAIFYFVFRPESPNYTLDALSVKSFNLSSSSPISPEFDLTLSAHNPNDKLGVYHLRPASVNLYYKDLHLCDALLPQFFQPRNNVTVFNAALKASSALELTTAVHDELIAAEKSGAVPFRVELREAAVKFRVGSVKSWRFNVKVRCDVTVDNLTAAAKIVSKDCDYSVGV